MTGIKKRTFNGEIVYGIPIEVVGKPYPLQGRTTLAVKAPYIAEQWYHKNNCGYTPEDFSFGSSVNAWWCCPKGPDHIWRQRINIRVSADCACPYCTSNKVSVTNSLATLFPEIAKQWHSTLNRLKPNQVMAHSTLSAVWRCPNNKKHIWKATIGDRTGQGTNCPQCAWEQRRISIRKTLSKKKKKPI